MSITKEQKKNVRIFLKRWKTIPPENVVKDLDGWQKNPDRPVHTPRCGTVACAGGWVALMPEFRALGVSVGRFGSPQLLDVNDPFEVAEHLFGAGGVFDGHHSYEEGTDHEVVTARFKALLK